MRSWLVPRWRDGAVAAALALLPFATFYRLWLTGPRAQHLRGDAYNLYWPDLVFLHEALIHGQVPLWNPFERGGVSMLSEPEAGVLYPLNWLLAAIGAVIGGMPFAMIEIKACLHLAIGGIALFAFLRYHGVPRSAALIGGVIYELGPYTVGNATFSLIWPQAWLPAVMLAADWLFDGGGSRAAIAVAGFAFLVVVAGSPPTAFYCSLVAIPYIGVRAVMMARQHGARALLAQCGPPWLLAALLAALSCYPALRGTFEAMRFSERAVRSFAYVSQAPLPAREWLAFVLRDASSTDVYVGLPSALLAAIGVVRWRCRPLAILFGTLAAVGVLLMLGNATPVLRWLYEWAPPFRLFRICSRYVFLVEVAVSILAAQGFAALVAPVRRDRSALIGIAVAIGVAIDLGSMAQRAGVVEEGPFDARWSLVSDAWVTRMQADADRYRIFAEFGLCCRPGSRLGLRDARGYLEPLAMKRVMDVYRRAAAYPGILALFNVRWLLHSAHPEHGLSHNFVKSVDSVPGLTLRDGAVAEFDEPAPNAYWVQGARVESTAAAAIARLPDLDPRGELVLAEEDVGEVPADRRMLHAPRVAATLEDRTLSSMRFVVDAPEPGYFVVNEAGFPGWRATVDDRDAPLRRGNAIVQVVELPAGRHVVALRFRPGYVLYPLALALAAWLLTLGWMLNRHLERDGRVRSVSGEREVPHDGLGVRLEQRPQVVQRADRGVDRQLR